MFVIMLTSSVVLLVTSTAFIAYEIATFRRATLQSSLAMAQVIAGNATAALTFSDERFGNEILAKLQSETTIVRASIYTGEGALLSRYPGGLPRSEFPLQPGMTESVFRDGLLEIFVPVQEGKTRLGTLYVETDLAPMHQRFWLYGAIVMAVMASSMFVAFLLSSWLQKRISAPILELAKAAHAVSVKKDYSVRAQKYGTDELGTFTDAFNQMLTQIGERDTALRESETRMRAVLNAAVTAVLVIDATDKIIDWNARAEQIFGWPREEALGRNLGETIIPERYREAHNRGMKHFLKTGEGPVLNRLIELSALRRDGTEFPVELSISPMKNGEVVTFCGFINDITERKKAAEALALLAAIVESSDDAIVGKDLDGTIVSWNFGAEQMFGYTAKEAIGRKPDFMIPPDRISEEVRGLQSVRQGKITHYETLRTRKDKTNVHVLLTTAPIKNAEGKIIGASASSRDITDRIRAEEEIRTLNRNLEQRVVQRTGELAAANHELEAFTYSVSHDLRAPLRHIDAFAQMLQEETNTSLSSEANRYLERIRNGVKNMGKLVDDLLNLSRVGRADVAHQQTSLNDIVNEVLADLKPELDKRAIEWKITKLPTVECDQGLIKQVFFNLISNAVKYTRRVENAVIEIGTQEIEGDTAIFVRDNGVGFNMKYANKLFGVFQRLHRAEEFEGTGVGLATVQRIVHLHRGRIWAEAELNKGAAFYFTLHEPETKQIK